MVGPLREDGAKSTSHRGPYVNVNRGTIRQVSCANIPKLWNKKVASAAAFVKPRNGFPISADDTVKKDAACLYGAGFASGDKRRKSTPNFRLCEPFCMDRLSTTLICRWRFCLLCPSCNA